MLSATIGLLLRKERTAQGISRAELAARGGVSVRLVAELERGARPNVSLETALQLLDVLGITLSPSTADAAAGRDAPFGDEATDRQERAARRAARRATWVGSLVSRSEMRRPHPPSSVAARLEAVTRASTLVHALSRGVESATHPEITSGQSARTEPRDKPKPTDPRPPE